MGARTLRQVMGLLEGDPIPTRIFVENLDWRIWRHWAGSANAALIWNDHRLAGFVTWANLDPALARALDEDDELRIEPEIGAAVTSLDRRCGHPARSEPALAAMFATLFPDRAFQQFLPGGKRPNHDRRSRPRPVSALDCGFCHCSSAAISGRIGCGLALKYQAPWMKRRGIMHDRVSMIIGAMDIRNRRPPTPGQRAAISAGRRYPAP